MSITTSRQEKDEAVQRLERLATEVLERDLVHWTVAAIETSDRYDEVQRQLHELHDLHEEENAWIRLHADELIRRRARAREEARS